LTKWSGRRTGASRGCARRWSTCLRWWSYRQLSTVVTTLSSRMPWNS